MNEPEIRILLPEGLSEGLSKEEARLLLALKAHEVGRISLGQAAKLAGCSKRAFMDLLGHYQIPVANYSPAELREKLRL